MQDIVPGVTRRGPAPPVPTRLLALVVIAAAVAWAIVQGAHSHDALNPVAADLGAAEVARVIHVDASTGQLTSRTWPSRRVRWSSSCSTGVGGPGTASC